jgi:polysaccharide biosynthesis/export protein
MLAGLSGCAESDAWLLDPSVVGRWEYTPTTVPILSRITSIEGPEDDFVEVSDVTAADLVPEVFEYRIGPGDVMLVEVYDLPEEGRIMPYRRTVDARGFITLPQLGQIYVAGHTVSGAEAAIMDAMRPLITDPVASIVVDQQRQQRYSVLGAVQAAGPYVVPVAEYRILEALTAAGGFSEAAEYIYVIRHIPLTDAVTGRPQPQGRPGEADPAGQPPPERLIDIIDELTRPPTPPPGGGAGPGGSPSVMRAQPAGGQPPIDLIENGRRAPQQPAAQAGAQNDANWVYLNGRWVRVQRAADVPTGIPDVEGVLGRPARTEQLFTQRVIRIPVQRLIAGDPYVNIVIRPNDVIRVPPAPTGNVYMLGQINRVGVYAMAERLTLRRVISAAGGFNAIAIPERIDLTRMVGPDRQATIRLNGRAIFRGTHPDIFLKANDEINVGTNFWATPMAVIRNGFRATYGFGFLLDRNFGNDVFGAPPANRFGQ